MAPTYENVPDYVPTFVPPLPVASVQELVKNDPLQVPDGYVRSQVDRPGETVYLYPCEIPVIDLSLLSTGDQEELKKLDQTLQEWGFFHVVNHGVAVDVLQSMKKASTEFFQLPQEEKKVYAMSNDAQGYGHCDVAFEDDPLEWSDAMLLVVNPPRFRKLEYWPTTPKGYPEIVEAYCNGVAKVAEQLMGALSLILGMDKDALLGMHREVLQALRINYYPACRRPDQVLGINPHTDESTVSVLMQDDDLIGLQIQHKGEWMPVQPMPNAFVVNFGDATEFFSNGKYKSVIHRAVPNDKKLRMSYASFFHPHEDVEVEPLDHLLSATMPRKLYKKIKFGDYIRLAQKTGSGTKHKKVANID